MLTPTDNDYGTRPEKVPERRGSLWSDPEAEIRNLPGIGHKLAKKVVEDLGDGSAQAAIVMVERNPYNLTDVDGIGFKKADRIAREAYDIGPDDIRRHEAGNRFILEMRGVLNEREFFAERVKLELRDQNLKEHGVELEEGHYWLPEELDAELQLERWMRGLPRGEALQLADLSEDQTAVLDRMGADDQQRLAVRAILANRVLCFTGGAGTGKTFCVAAAMDCGIRQRWSARGMAFAGKAADRMREALDAYGVMAEATTIHKALGFQKKSFTVDVLGEKLYVIDEASMLPNWLLWAVIKRLPEDAHLVLVGDPNQLPPIGYGTPFVDLLKHGAPHVHLEKNYRQQDQQGILHMAEGILNRSRPAPAECVEMHLYVAPANLDSLFDSLIQKHGGPDYEGWQVITYTNEVAERYNLRAQAIVNPGGVALFEYPLWKLGTGERNRPLYHAEVREGDKVIVVKNSTTLGIFNGQTGRVLGLTSKAKIVQRKNSVTGHWEEQIGDVMPHLLVDITGREVAVPEDEVEKFIQLGYVITVHKAQGSDWPRVIVMQPGKVRDDTARKFFYTASTRAKNHLCIVSGLRVVAWWTNAATDAPDVPSTLMKRLAKAKPMFPCLNCGTPVAHLPHDGICWDCVSSMEGGLLVDPADLKDYEPEPGPEFDAAIERNGHARPLLPSEWEDVKHSATPATWRTLRQSAPVAAAEPHQTGEDSERIAAQFRALDVVW
ncbi:AAA family ATPase [Deinococcus arenicola]|uniref:AAA family ATPase n=1 Tax=Deinococcus arenicola TaxID=2994950 RepID=A0ABU4DVI7_9DEIO|nr:AAA family ATPase [Deinococcus sp. ZS9-10]MDV6376465.1 AAA family ATPase [Deinococcus sp. ZS9-10]